MIQKIIGLHSGTCSGEGSRVTGAGGGVVVGVGIVVGGVVVRINSSGSIAEWLRFSTSVMVVVMIVVVVVMRI